MRKQYIEPELLVEDFTVSEMIAANCELLVNELTVVQQMSHTGCEGYYDDWQVTDAYAKLSDYYDGEKDVDGNGTPDACFTSAYADRSPGSDICSFVPYEHGINFGGSVWDCTGDSSLIQNS